MSNRDQLRRLAEIERAKAIAAEDVASCREHIDRARDYDWRAEMEPRNGTSGSAA